EGLAASGGMKPPTVESMMSVEEMDKRIADLRAVENWLRMNLSMLSSTIQGLEVQRATVATLRSFVDSGMAMAQSSAGARDTQAAPKTSAAAAATKPVSHGPAGVPPQAASRPQDSGESRPGAAQAAKQSATGAAKSEADQAATAAEQIDLVAAASTAAQSWWDLLQQQFQTLAAASAASTANADVSGKPAGAASGGSARKAASRTASARKTAAGPATASETKKASKSPASATKKALSTKKAPAT